jgi:type VI secretion system protein ImpK
MSAYAAPLPMRSNSLSMAFQDVITVILRVRYRTQRVADANAFRDSIRKMIAAAAQETRQLGYSDQTSHMALYAIVGFLDESVLSSQDPTFQAWARRPLQEEMFGGHFAGEYFFRHVAELLNLPESSEVADALELHAICLLLGYRGKYGFGDSGEIMGILQRIRQKIARIRGPLQLCRVEEAPAVVAPKSGDAWVTRLILATGAMAVLVLVAFGLYWMLLGNGLHAVETSVLDVPRWHSAAVLATLAGVVTR